MNKKENTKNKLVFDTNRNTQLIFRGIRDEVRSFQGKLGIFNLKDDINKVRKELNARYVENLPIGISEVFRLIDYIIQRFEQWLESNELLGNDDAEIFLDSLMKQLEELNEILKEI